MSTDLGISIPTAGLLVSLYALGVAIGGPLLATFTGRFPRKLLLLIYVSIFTVGYIYSRRRAELHGTAHRPHADLADPRRLFRHRDGHRDDASSTRTGGASPSRSSSPA